MSIAEITELVGLISTGLGLIGMIVAYVKKTIKELKEKKLKELIEQLMADVEVLAISGDLKKSKVLAEVQAKFGEGKDIYEKASAYIEECIEFSKKINHKK